MREQYKHLVNFSANFVMMLVDALLFGYIWYTFYKNWQIDGEVIYTFTRRGHWAVIGLYVLIVYFFSRNLGGYRLGYVRVLDIVLSNILALFLSNMVAYVEICLILSDYANPLPLISVMIFEMLFVVVWNALVREVYKRLYPPRQILLVYGEYAPDDMIDKMNARRDKYNICASISYGEIMGIMEDILPKYHGVILCDLPAEARNDIMKFCYNRSVRVYVTPKITDVLFRGAEDIHLFDTPLYMMRNQGLTIDQRFVKRTFDIVLSIIGIVLASPFMLVIAIAIKLYDGGPILYKQERYTRDQEVFQVLKFRSMTTKSQENGVQITAQGDSRVTPVGGIIRAIHFDELPQLFNILAGQMSIVGPRPEWKPVVDAYIKEIPEFVFRTKVKAGLTGYAQVWGKYNTTPYDKLKLDLTYIENYSLWMDIKILLMTFKILFVKENTEGVSATQTTALKGQAKQELAEKGSDDTRK